jgi:hypothetical protein
VIGQTVRLHDEWFIIVPMFMISVGIWIIFRSLTFSLLWMLSNKLIDCYLTMIQANLDQEKHKISFIKLMASKGKEKSFGIENTEDLVSRYSVFWSDYLANTCLFDIINLFY